MQTTEKKPVNGQRYAWIGFALGIACMVALFVYGLITGKPQLMVIASSVAALLGVVWASTSAAAQAATRRRAVTVPPPGPTPAPEAPPEHPTADDARGFLREANRLESASRAGASWPHITMQLGLGAITSLTLISFWLVGRFDESLVAVPLIALLIWLGILMVFMLVFGRSTKRGFSRRWKTFMAIWTGLWIVGVLLTTTVFSGELWFTLVITTAITVNSVVGAWWEARS
ncbi:MAG: hypothetical protein ACTHZK_11550 [Arthrobacter sp.]|nr:hypothetical protein [Micrococcaceae bacterium]MDN6170075.1 hypothetical protein [Micrococcaceae bacterium]